jgi:hypothetical protein
MKRWFGPTIPNIFGYQNNSEHVVEVVGNAADTSYTSTPVTVTVSLEEGLLFVSTYRPSSGQAFGVVNFQNVMFVATGEGGVEVLSVVDKTAPEYLSRFESAGQALKVDVQYPDLFIADLSGGAIRADFSDPDSLMACTIFRFRRTTWRFPAAWCSSPTRTVL